MSDNVHNSIDNLPRESRATLFVTAPSIRARVGRGLKEVVQEAPVCAVYLYPSNRVRCTALNVALVYAAMYALTAVSVNRRDASDLSDRGIDEA